MPDAPPTELISLSDEEQGVTLRILRAEDFSDSGGNDTLRAEIIVTSAFVGGRVVVHLNSHDLDAWEEALNTVAADQGATWLESGRSPRIQVTPPAISESECVEVSVCDIPASQVCVTIPVVAPDDWIERHRVLLAAVRRRFPLA